MLIISSDINKLLTNNSTDGRIFEKQSGKFFKNLTTFKKLLNLKKFNLKQEPSGKVTIALAAHWQGAQIYDDYCFMHVSDSGYTGISSIGKDKANVVLVVNRSSMNGEKSHGFYINSENIS